MRKLLIIALALLWALPMAAASDHHEDAAEEAAEQEAERGDGAAEWEYEISVTSERASIQMSREAGESESAISFEYERDDAAIEFEMEAETAASESEASMEVQFHQLFEYEDENSNGRYDEGETIVQAFQLSADGEESLTDAETVSWNPIVKSAATSDNGVAGTKFSSSAAIGSGTFRLDFYVFGDEATLGAASIEATELKLDIAIMNFPFQSETSAIGLLLESESEAEVEDDSDVEGDEEGVVANAGTAQLLFAWKDFADVDGQRTSVESTRLSSDTSQEPGEYEHEELFVFSYARGNDVLHDPTMGVSTANSSKGAPGAGALLLAVPLLAFAAIMRRRAE